MKHQSARTWGLRAFGDVRPGEARAALWLALNGFLLLTAYYVLKTVREPLILLSGTFGLAGDELKIYGTAAQAGLLFVIVPLYGRLARKADRLRLLRSTLLVFMASLVGFAALGAAGVPIGVPFYVWLGIASLLGIAQFWSFVADLHSREEGERLFGLVGAGGAIGAIAGAQAARWLVKPLGVFALMLIAAVIYGLSLVVVSIVNREAARHPRTKSIGGEPIGADPTPAMRGTLALVFRDRYLLLIAALMVIANLVNTQGEYILAAAVKAHAAAVVPMPVEATEAARAALEGARRAVIGRVFGDFFTVVNAVSLLLQALLVSRLFKHIGVRAALFVLPLVALAGYGAIAMAPAFLVVLVAKGAENACDYSVQNTTRHALYLPTTRDVKYRAKAAIDTIFVRSGDLAAAGLVAVGVHALHLSPRGFALLNMGLVGVMIGVAAALARAHARLVGAEAAPERRVEPPRVAVPRRSPA